MIKILAWILLIITGWTFFKIRNEPHLEGFPKWGH